MKALLLLLFLPAVAFGQINLDEEKKSDENTYHPHHAKPIVIQNGNVVTALYKVVYDTIDEASYFDLVIHTHSYREALKPSDGDALFIVDGLGKVFKILHWTSRYKPDKKIVSSIAIRMTKEEFKSISYAGTVGLKIGINSFFIPHTARHNMRRIVAQIESVTGNKTGFYKTTGIKVSYRDGNEKLLASNLGKLKGRSANRK